MGVSETEIRLWRTFVASDPSIVSWLDNGALVWALRHGDTFHVRETEFTRKIRRWDTLEHGGEHRRILHVEPVQPGQPQLIELRTGPFHD